MKMVSEPTLLRFGNGSGARTSHAACRSGCCTL